MGRHMTQSTRNSRSAPDLHFGRREGKELDVGKVPAQFQWSSTKGDRGLAAKLKRISQWENFLPCASNGGPEYLIPVSNAGVCLS